LRICARSLTPGASLKISFLVAIREHFVAKMRIEDARKRGSNEKQ